MNIINEELSLQGLKTIKVEVGKLATQTDASVEVRCGNNVLFYMSTIRRSFFLLGKFLLVGKEREN